MLGCKERKSRGVEACVPVAPAAHVPSSKKEGGEEGMWSKNVEA